MFVNTQEFRRDALYFQKNGRYPEGTTGSIEWEEYWDIQHDRCMNGYKVGDTYITGFHYYYLNFHPIMKVEEKDEYKYTIDLLRGEDDLVDSKRIKGFPDFWDLDYEYFTHLEKAQRLGKNIIWLKGRGCGASFKGSALLSRNYHFIKESKGYAIADNEDYLIDDGILTKFLMAKAFLYKHTEFGKSSDFKAAEGELKWRASYSAEGEKEERGYLSEVMGVVLKRDWQKARGKRGELVLFEEGGKFPNLDKAWKAVQDSVEQGRSKYGTMIAFGTGGTENKDFGPMSKMFYSPEAFNILPCENIWDENMKGTTCGLFTPSYWNIDFKDKDGNTNKLEAKAYFDKRRKLAESSPDPNDLKQEKAEQPYCPQDAILILNENNFPRQEAKIRRSYVISNKLDNSGVPGLFVDTTEGIKFTPDENLVPLKKWKYSPKDNRSGCPVIYHTPYRKDGEVPDNLYIIGHDPYDRDDAEGPSVGAAYVYMMPNDYIIGGGRRIVATYFARPNSLDEYNYQLFCLAKYYNAKIGFENDRGDVIGYAKRTGQLSLLAEEFKLAFDLNLAVKKLGKKFGMTMGSGKTNKRKKAGDEYLVDMLNEVVAINSVGQQITFLNTIDCISTLEEISEFDPEKGNFDRISALRILIYYIKELQYANRKPQDTSTKNKRKFFKRRLF